MDLPPWLNFTPQFFQGALEAGGRLGLSQRAQDASESEAADRLRLAYDSLASKEQMANEQSQSKMQLAQSAMDLRAAQNEGLQTYRQGQIDLRQQAVDNAAAALQSKRDKLNIHFGPNGQVLQEKDGEVSVLRPADPKDFKYTGPHVSFFENGIEYSGPADQPDIAKMLAKQQADKAAKAAQSAAGSNSFSLLHPSTWFGGTAPATTGTTNAVGAVPSAAAALQHPQKISPWMKFRQGPYTNRGGVITGSLPHRVDRPPQSAIDYLKQHPDLKNQFDEKYGEGAADDALGE